MKHNRKHWILFLICSVILILTLIPGIGLATAPNNPDAADDSFTVAEDSISTVFDVLANDLAGNSGTLSVTSVTQPVGGAVSFTSSNVSFVPTANFYGATTFTYTLSESGGSTATATVTVTVTAVNDPPSAVNDSITVLEDSSATVLDVLANDTCEPDTGETLTITAVTQPASGTVSFTSSSIGFIPAVNFNGITTFTYTISDGNGGTATATVTVTVTAVNDSPSANDDSFTVGEDSISTAVNVLANDAITPDMSETLSVTAVTQPANGTVTFTSSSVRFTPAANFNGTTTFTYTVSDGNGGTATATVTVTVTAVNDPPSAVNDSFTVAEDSSTTAFDVLANDSTAPDTGETLTVTAITQPAAGGTVTLVGGIVRFTPTANFNGTTTFTYTISDGNGGTAAATITVTVTAVNDSPSAVNDSFTVTEDSGATVFDVLANDAISPDINETLSITAVTQPANGTVTFTSSSIGFTPAVNFNGTTTFTYTISDGNGGTATATVTVTVTAVNDPPSAVNDTLTIAEDSGATVVNVLANDSTAPDTGETLTVTAITQPAAGGTVTLESGVVRFTPAANFNGTVTFTYTASDSNGGTAAATITVTVTAVNDSPVAVNDSFTVTEDSSATFVNVLGNDSCTPDIGETLSITAVTQPASGGTVALVGGVVRFTPTASFKGSITFTYTISDGHGGTATATVTVTVTAPPSATNDTLNIAEDSSATIVDVLANDSFAPDTGETLSVTAVTQPAAGGIVTLVSGVVCFTPAANYNGVVSFTYTISDGIGGTAMATVTVTVTAVNDSPSAANDTLTIAEDSGANIIDVLANDSFVPDTGETLSVTAVTQPAAGGTVALLSGIVRFTPAANFNGNTTFTYTVSDGNGGTATATVTVTVTAVNDQPSAANDTLTIAEDSGATVVNVLANDSIAPDTFETLTVTAVTQPAAGGTVTLLSGVVRFTPAANYNGTASFTYTISDGNGGTAAATVTVTVTAVNDTPSAANDTLTIAEDSGATVVNVLANDSIAPDTFETLTVTALTQPAAGGTVALLSGAVRFTPTANFNGTSSFTYTISDSNGGTAAATVTVTVTAVNDLPSLQEGILGSKSAKVLVKGTYQINLLSIFRDADGDQLSYTVTADHKNPVAANADYAYTPNSAGSTKLVFRSNDGQADSTDTYTVILTAADSAENSPAPVFVADVSMDMLNTTLPVAVDVDNGSAQLDLAGLHQNTQNNTDQLVVTFPSIPNIDLYTVDMPLSFLSGMKDTSTLTLHTGLGSVILPPDMLTDIFEKCESEAEITIGLADKNSLPKEVINAFGERPLIEITLFIDGKPVEWENAETPFTVSITYAPTPEELNNLSEIAVWCLDSNGQPSRVQGVQYDTESGCLVFTVTHFGIFTVGMEKV